MTDLGLDLRTGGRAHRPIEATIVRELHGADLCLLELDRGVKAPTIKRLSDAHHGLARTLALGAMPAEASAVTGYSPSRISILQGDPTFQELIAFYRRAGEGIFADFSERMLTTGLTAQALLQERLEENPDAISDAMLHDIVKLMADRTGHGPATKNTNLNLNVDLGARIAAGRARAQLGGAVGASRGPFREAPALIESHAEPVPSQTQESQDGS